MQRKNLSKALFAMSSEFVQNELYSFSYLNDVEKGH